MLKKITALIITAVLTTSLSMTSFAMPSDISGHWAESMIRRAIRLGVFNDEPHLLEKFEPNRHMMVVEFCGVLNRLNNFTKEADVTFPDVSASSPYLQELRRAYAAGYFFGDERGRANPERLLTRAEMATMVHRVYKYPAATGEASKFKDFNDIPPWAVEAVEACVKKGIMRGDDKQQFRPNDRLTRAEMVALVFNIAGL